MVNYQLGKIYKLVCRITGEIYIGSTCEPTLARRLVAHRAACKQYHEKNRGTYFSSFQMILRGDYYIDLLENYPSSNNDELRQKEREYFDKIVCINKCRPLVTHDEILEDKRCCRGLYTEDKIEEIKQYMKAYRETHRDDRAEYDKLHKEVIKEQQTIYIAANREHINELKMKNYHKNKRQKTEEEIEKKRLMQIEKALYMRSILKEKREALRRENPNYDEEKKIRQKERHRLNLKKYRERDAKKREEMNNSL